MASIGRRRPGWTLLAGAALALAGCGGPPPPPPPTVVALKIVVGPDANPGPGGQGAPVLMRVYQLGSSAGFMGAEFFPLYNQDSATLGPDLLKRDEFLLSPGQTRTLTLMPKDDAQALGVFAAWRDFQHAIWRASTDLAPHQVNTVTVTVNHAGVTLTNEKPPPKPGS